MRHFQNTFETRKRSFSSDFSICMTEPLITIFSSHYISRKCFENMGKPLLQTFTPNMLCPTCKLPEF